MDTSELQSFEMPFPCGRSEDWFYPSPLHDEALARLFFLVENQWDGSWLQGPAGTGKTLLLNRLDQQLRRTQRQTAFVDLTGKNSREVPWELAASLRIGPKDGELPTTLWRRIRDYLHSLQWVGQQTVLIFDHLDEATGEVLGQLRQLLHLGRSGWGGVTLITAARQIEGTALAAGLAGLANLRIEVGPLDATQTADYVKQRFDEIGWQQPRFSSDALQALFRETKGVPRAINQLANLSVLAGLNEHRELADATVVEAAAREWNGLELRPGRAQEAPDAELYPQSGDRPASSIDFPNRW